MNLKDVITKLEKVSADYYYFNAFFAGIYKFIADDEYI